MSEFCDFACVLWVFAKKITHRPPGLTKFPMPAARHENKENPAVGGGVWVRAGGAARKKRRSLSAAEAAAGACGGAVAEPPAVVVVGVAAVRTCHVRAPAATGSGGEAAALGAVHARELGG